MYKFIILLFLMLFISCSSNRTMRYEGEYEYSLSDTIQVIIEDELEFEAIEIHRLGQEVENESVCVATEETIKEVEKSEDIVVEEYKIIKESDNEINIIDLVDTSKIIEPDFGIIAYNIPDHFKVNEYVIIKLRISKSKNIQSVVIGDRNIPIVLPGSDDKVIVETILISDSMSADLYCDIDVFDINLTSNKNQNIFETGYTEWVWIVRPLRKGTFYIKLLITISGRDIVVYEKNIEVKNDIRFSLGEWFIKWWQPITATVITPILIPLGIWLYRRKRKGLISSK